jgi:uncharacterized protein YkwD
MAREASIGARAIVVLALVAIGVALPASPAAAHRATCKNATARPGTVSKAKLREAVDCLINKARARRDVGQLKPNSDLDHLGQGHSRLMVKRHCFRHRCGDEASVKQRFEASPYVKGASAFRYSEELGYETTPKQLVLRILGSKTHRAVVLDGAFRDIGVGVHTGAPVKHVDASKFMTYTIELGARSK